ncbi:hypothetical protein pb186bvf_000592 [Paramecium bursaria]
MTIIKFCSEECLFIYIDKNLQNHCMKCYLVRYKNFDEVVHFRIYVNHIKEVLQNAAKFAKDFKKLYNWNYAKPNKFLDLYLDRLHRQLNLINQNDEEILVQNLYKLFNQYREELKDISILKNTIQSNFLQNIFQYFCINIMKYIKDDIQNSQNLNKNQKFIIIELYGCFLEINQDYINRGGNSLINKNWFFARIKIFLREFYGFQGNIDRFKEIQIFWILRQSQRDIHHYLYKNQLRRQEVIYKMTDHNKQNQRENLHKNGVYQEQYLIQYSQLKEFSISQNLELEYDESQDNKLKTLCKPLFQFDNSCIEKPYLAYIFINLPTIFETSNQFDDSVHSIQFISIRDDI